MVTLLSLLTLFLLAIFAIGIAFYMQEKQSHQIEQDYKEQYLANSLKLEEALEDWLVMLELPQFEDQKKRKEAASRLSIVLIERLLLVQKPS